MSSTLLPRADLFRMVAVRILIAIPTLAALFFLPAGTLAYWEAWAYLAVLIIPMVFVFAYLLKYDPDLLARRMRLREKEAAQKRIINASLFWFIIAFLIPGLDRRFEWSAVPVALVIAADALVLVGYTIIFFVFRENTYTSRIIEVERGQKVISTGVYAIVRHPMYLGACVMYIASPLALGSYWAILPALLIVPILIARIRDEERVLIQELEGYEAYRQKVRYRLIPGVW
jgi:protein-S-isoprenylcysteine O-methyltransferase Ste14